MSVIGAVTVRNLVGFGLAAVLLLSLVGYLLLRALVVDLTRVVVAELHRSGELPPQTTRQAGGVEKHS